MSSRFAPAARADRARERGAILLVALVLAASFAVLGLVVLAGHDAARDGRVNARALDRAERAATSGIEWAAARVVERGPVDATTTLTLGADTTVVVDVDTTSPPRVVARGRASGVEATLTAELVLTEGAPLPYAFASMNGVSRVEDRWTIRGSAYFGNTTTAISASGSDQIEMHGDLHLVASGAPPTGSIVHVSGATTRGAYAYPTPVVDVQPFRTMTSGAVPVLRYSGNTTFDTRSIDGIVVVELGAAQVLTIRDSTIRGTVVVTPSADLLGGGGLLGTGLLKPEVRLRGNTTIVGGTTTTGNLALLAHACGLDTNHANAVVEGVVLVDRVLEMKQTVFRGQLVLLNEMASSTGDWSVERPAGFQPSTPIGVRWPGPSSVRIRWLGRS